MITAILSSLVKTPHGKGGHPNERTVAEILLFAAHDISREWSGPDFYPSYFQEEMALFRKGIGMKTLEKMREVVCISTESEQIQRILESSHFFSLETEYDQYLCEEESCLNPEGPGEVVEMAGLLQRTRLFDWEKFREKYLEESLRPLWVSREID